MKILLVRHGEADSTLDDAKRKLTPGGKRDMIRIGRIITGSNWMFSRFYSSPLDRAVETAGILCNAYNENSGNSIGAESKKELAPGNPVENIESLLEGMNSSDAAVWAFHMPDVAAVASYFTGLSETSFYVPPGTVIALNVPVSKYHHNSMMVYMLQPEQLLNFS